MATRSRRLVWFVCAAVIAQALVASSADASSADDGNPASVEVMAGPATGRSAGFAALYLSFGALQMLDVHSTLRATAAGGREANPSMGRLISSPAAFVAAKAGVSAGLFVATERMRKQHPRGAMLTMVGLNSAYAMIVGHNYRVESRALRNGGATSPARQ